MNNYNIPFDDYQEERPYSELENGCYSALEENHFTFHPKYLQYVKELEPENQAAAIFALIEYGVNGLEPARQDNIEAYRTVLAFREDIDNSIKAIKNGRKGGKARGKKSEGQE